METESDAHLYLQKEAFYLFVKVIFWIAQLFKSPSCIKNMVFSNFFLPRLRPRKPWAHFEITGIQYYSKYC